MQDKIIAIGTVLPDTAIGRCRAVLEAGGVIVYPTDTFYALGVDPENIDAVRRLFLLKGRRESHPILLLIADRSGVSRWANEVNAAAQRLMDRFWPGPLTLVFPARADVPAALSGGSGTIGLRVPGNPTTRALLAGVRMALTGTSANRSGEMAPRTIDMVMGTIGDQVDLILDGGPTTAERPSTVVDVSREVPKIIRHGAIDPVHLL